ncbi:MAG: membrane dipeptidase [Bacteroidales bacterium]|nr:membrane dipeptidase [Bacteroidales bacterium]
MKTNLVDAHFDLAMDVERQRCGGRKKVIESDYLHHFKEGGFGAIVSSIFVQNEYIPEMALRMAIRQIAALKNDIAESNDLVFCTSYSQIIEANQKGSVGILLSFEDCIPLYADLCLLSLFYELGVRFMGIAWNRRNMACDGSNFLKSTTIKKPGGLTEFGFQLVDECLRLGIILDVSHLNDEGFWDLCEYTDIPFIASHSNASEIAPSKRNLSDAQIREIIRRKGFIGINNMNFIVASDARMATVSTLCDHIEHIMQLGGEDVVGFGFDFNDPIMKYVTQSENNLTPYPCKDILNGHSGVHVLIQEMEHRKFGEENIRKICGGNFLRIVRDGLS